MKKKFKTVTKLSMASIGLYSLTHMDKLKYKIKNLKIYNIKRINCDYYEIGYKFFFQKIVKF